MNANNGNGNGTKPLDADNADTQSKIDEVLEQHKTNKPGKGNPPGGPQQKPSKTEEKTKEQPKTGAIAKASEAVETKLGEKAQVLVEADKKQQLALLALGRREAREDAKMVQLGYQDQMMADLTRIKVSNTQSLAQQLELLRQHNDVVNAEEVAESLQSMMGDSDGLSPLNDLLGQLDDLAGLDSEIIGKEGLKILGKG